MPRASNGTFTLPSGTVVSPGDTLLVSQHNPALLDIAQAITNSLSRDGYGAMRADLAMGDNKITGLADAEDDGDAVPYSQLIDLFAQFSDGEVLTADAFRLQPFWEASTAGDATVIRCGGDSTTVQADQYPAALTSLVEGEGYTVETSGASGKHTGDWVSTYLAGDIAADAPLFIWGYGMNDLYTPYARTIDDFRSDLIAGLAEYRETRPASTNAVILLSPNMALDGANGRDLDGIRELDAIIRAAAKTYQCAYVNRYLLFPPDGEANDFLDPANVHPTPPYVQRITGAIANFILTCDVGTQSTSMIADKLAVDPPESYPQGYSCARTTMDGGDPQNYPFDGFVHTFMPVSSGGYFGLQINHPYGDADGGYAPVAVRWAIDGSPPWRRWNVLRGDRITQGVTTGTGFTSPGSTEGMRVYSRGGAAFIEGYFDKTVPAALTVGQVIGTLPEAHFRPYMTHWGLLGLAFVAGPTWEPFRCKIDPTNGQISIVGLWTTGGNGVALAERIYIEGSWALV